MADEELLDPDVVARILSRANELTSPHGAPQRDPSSGVSEAALLAAAEEVGLSLEAVRRSVAIERLGPLPARRLGDRLFGAGVVVVDDEIAGKPRDVLTRLDHWLVEGHHLRRDRLRGDTAEWSKRGGAVGMAMRSVRSATGEGHLGEFQRITAVATDAGSGSTVVRVAVDRRRSRGASTGSGAFVAAGGTAAIIVGAVAASPLLLIATPVAVLAGIGVACTGRGRAKRTELEVERLLESINEGETPTRLSVDIAKRVVGIGRRSSSPAGRIVPAPPSLRRRVPPPPPAPPPPR